MRRGDVAGPRARLTKGTRAAILGSMPEDSAVSRSLVDAVRIDGRPLAVLARAARMDRSALSRFVTGERGLTIGSAERLAEALGGRLRFDAPSRAPGKRQARRGAR